MLQGIRTPMPAVEQDLRGGLLFWTALGVISELAVSHEDISTHRVGHWLTRIESALQSGQCQVFLDDEGCPWGYASWAVVDQLQHERWLSGDYELPENWMQADSNYQTPHLWFVDLLSPFCSTLPILQSLRQILADHEQAWTFDMNGIDSTDGPAPQPRRLW